MIPAYNEERRIGPTIGRILEYLEAGGQSFEVLVVLDGTRDRTAEIVERMRTRGAPLTVLGHPINRGKGYCVRRGMLAARGDLRLFSDADLSTPIEELGNLATAIAAGYDIAIGSRRLSQSVVSQTRTRKVMGQVFNWFAQRLVLPGIAYTQCGFKLFSADAAERIFPRQLVDRFSFDVELLYIAMRLGLRVAERQAAMISKDQLAAAVKALTKG